MTLDQPFLHALNYIPMTDRLFTEEERDLFAMSFYLFALTDPRAQALIEARTPTGAILALYKDRAYIDNDPSKQ